MSDFDEKWQPRWKLEAQFPGCDFCTFAEGCFKTGRPRYRWIARDRATKRKMADRWAMLMISKQGNEYFLVATADFVPEEKPSDMSDVYESGS